MRDKTPCPLRPFSWAELQSFIPDPPTLPLPWVVQGDGEWGLWSPHNISSATPSSPHFSPCSSVGPSHGLAAWLMPKHELSMAYNLLQGRSTCFGILLLLWPWCSRVISHLFFPLSSHMLLVSILPFLKHIFAGGSPPGCGALPCPVVGPLKLGGTSYIWHWAAPASATQRLPRSA